MSSLGPKNMADSVKQRLLNLSKQDGGDFNFLLARYAVERLLFRLASSPYGGAFILKGAMLFHLQSSEIPHRATHDLDLLGQGVPDIARMKDIFGAVCRAVVCEDGLEYPENAIRAEPIKEEDAYLGVRIKLVAMLGKARIPVQVDIGFGDVITPPPLERQLVGLLDFPASKMRVYPWETVIAEKFHAIVTLAMDNTRMKDYFDLYHLAMNKSFEGEVLSQAIQAAFARRETRLPLRLPIGIDSVFANDSIKQVQWRSFGKKLKLNLPPLPLVVELLALFLMPPVYSAGQDQLLNLNWKAGGPWQ